MKNRIVILMLVFMTLQSCVVYNEPVASLEEARDKGKVKILYKNGLKRKFKNIVMQDSLYVGVTFTYHASDSSAKETKYKYHYNPIAQDEVLEIYVKNNLESVVGTSVLIAAPILLLYLLYLLGSQIF